MRIILFISSLLFLIHSIQAQESPKIWTFKNLDHGKTLILKQGQTIKVAAQVISSRQMFKGKLQDISNDSVYLKSRDRKIVLGTKDVADIRIKQSKSIAAILIGTLLLIVGVPIIILAPIFYYYSPVVGVERKSALPWMALGIGLSAIAFVLFSKETKITDRPFSDRWEMYQHPVSGNKGP